QRVQGEMVKSKQAEVTEKHRQLTEAKKQKSTLLARGERERINLENKQTEQKQMVNTLQKQQKTIQQIIEKQRRRDAELNTKIERLIAEELERARARAEAEAKRKAAEAEAAARKAEKERREKSGKAEKNVRNSTREVAETKKTGGLIYRMDSEDRRISGSFESNKGRLPMPLSGGYRIVNHFGQYNVEGLKNVRLDNKGISIQGQPGAQVRSIFDGEVSAVFNYAGKAVIMVRHGSYISVYSNFSTVSVHKGQKVKARQALGVLDGDNILQFQLYREKTKLNPEPWLGR
ncbi:MAG: murein hydrolase activator EnvC family protein, partial [Prevotella sp.]